MAARAFNIAGKAPKQLGEEILAELKKGGWSADREKVKALIDADADLEVRDEKGNTPLLLATLDGMSKIAIDLIEGGANINAVNNRKESALILSLGEVSMNDDRDPEDMYKIADALLAKKPDVNIVSVIQESALTIVAKRGLFRYVGQIVALDPDFDVTDTWGNTALELARDHNSSSRSLEILEEAYTKFTAQKVVREHQEKVTAVGKMMAGGMTEEAEAPVTASFVRKTRDFGF